MRASQFNSREVHETGVKVFLPLPDGTPTEEFVILCGRDSRSFRKAQTDYRERMVAAAADGKDFDTFIEGARLTASAVKSWSLEDPCTPQSVATLLENAPYLVDLLDTKMYDSKSFFVGKE